MRRLVLITWVAAVLTSILASHAATQTIDDGAGWEMTQLDLTVHIEPEDSRLRLEGTASLRLEKVDESLGPLIWVNGRNANMEFVAATANGVEAKLGRVPDRHSIRTAKIELDGPVPRGSTLQVAFECVSNGASAQFLVESDHALASWVEAWHPLPRSSNPSDAKRTGVPGTTTFRMPPDWTAVTNGTRISRDVSPDEAIEVWKLDRPVARSFALGPYELTRAKRGDREIVVARLDDTGAEPAVQADALAQAIRAVEERLGPYPYAQYWIAEIPDHSGAGFLASSEQGFIMGKSDVFQHGTNLPLFAHESSHGWWGNLVGATGPGAIMCDEALAQYSMVYALEKVEGIEASRQFLEFSREGYPQLQCAKGYFQIARDGNDEPLGAMTGGRWPHQLSDSKGMWFYHMLRMRVGDEVFWNVLAEFVRSRAGSEISLADVREAYLAASPDAGLERFFEDWLEREGAPILEATWNEDGLQIEQKQDGDLYALTLDVDIHRSDRPVERIVFELTERSQVRALADAGSIERIELDPDRKVLIWRPEYGDMP